MCLSAQDGNVCKQPAIQCWSVVPAHFAPMYVCVCVCVCVFACVFVCHMSPYLCACSLSLPHSLHCTYSIQAFDEPWLWRSVLPALIDHCFIRSEASTSSAASIPLAKCIYRDSWVPLKLAHPNSTWPSARRSDNMPQRMRSFISVGTYIFNKHWVMHKAASVTSC